MHGRMTGFDALRQLRTGGMGGKLSSLLLVEELQCLP